MGESGLGSEIRSLRLWGRTYRGVGGPEEIRYPLTDMPQQTSAIIQHLPDTQHRHILKKVSRLVSLPVLLGTNEGIDTLAKNPAPSPKLDRPP